MKTIECPACGGELDLFVDVLNPMAAVGVDMLERAVMYQCKSCMDKSPDFSKVHCPQCFETSLITRINDKPQIEKTEFEGFIFCSNCDFKQIF